MSRHRTFNCVQHFKWNFCLVFFKSRSVWSFAHGPSSLFHQILSTLLTALLPLCAHTHTHSPQCYYSCIFASSRQDLSCQWTKGFSLYSKSVRLSFSTLDTLCRFRFSCIATVNWTPFWFFFLFSSISFTDDHTWPAIAADFCSGSRQSPIDISSTAVVDYRLGAFTFTGFDDKTAMSKIENTGKTGTMYKLCTLSIPLLLAWPPLSQSSSILVVMFLWCIFLSFFLSSED